MSAAVETQPYARSATLRIGFAVVGAVACLLVLDAFGAGRLLHATLDEAVDAGLGVLLLPLGVFAATLLAHPRSVVRAGLALGVLAPNVAWLVVLGGDALLARVAWVVVFLGCLLVARSAIRDSGEPAAARTLFTAAGLGALLLGCVATLAWWPRSVVFGPEERVLPTWQIAVATICLMVSLRDLHARRARALVSLAAAGLLIAASPTLGEVQSGCVGLPGPLETLLFPRLVVPAILSCWAGPVARAVRDRYATKT
ncbi:hypothetical protein [Sandaracinus amylolyticus]|uniref:hypothetical protein n=1 Tax=Sandaracinus amylolyticus TaxID=927083 RepID=UPI0012ED1E61|nr:hypothetical protein [Sandaracinus amylolyticus]